MKTPQLQIDFNLPIDFTEPFLHKENNSESQKHFDGNIEHFSNQCKKTYTALIKGERLTTTKALLEYGIGHLPRRIKDLTDIYGVKGIESVFIEGKYKEYYININPN
ncbi:helix-turn-helix domain-containing protein [Flavobacterium sp. 102]|uniref:helix-turn-helix domain-containing protein n=1 Tax=Flavobacterium sp. 102 TaxID=2135623 RepID=UPI000EAEB6A2|nr:helix-turn-helix domain-containing protein [Flavobacterium sp. 102]RKS00453.1 helix-turn-helix protein [Flavobacterium sp. 102]